MKIHVYAALKDHFEPEFELQDAGHNTDELRVRLQGINADAAELLKSCRFAVEDGFIDNDFPLQDHDTVIVIPPANNIG